MLQHKIIDEYLKYDELYKEKYNKYLVLLQVGSFYEAYSTIHNDIRFKIICELLNIVLTRKNKSIQNISKSNPLLFGFPCVSLEKYLDILINNNYTVIVYNQYTEKSKIKRKLDKIYSIATYDNIEKNNNNSNILMTLYNENIKDNIIIGISMIDILTGNINIIELYNNNDIHKLIEDINKYLIIYNPKEIIYTSKNESNHNIINLLKKDNIIFHNKELNNEYLKINYQNEYLNHIYKKYNFGLLSSIEFLNLEKYQYGLISFIIGLNFAYNYDNSLIDNINIPNIILNEDKLNLHNNAVYQLDLFSNNNNNNNNKYNSLYDVLNKNSTILGKRLLKEKLSNPYINKDKLNIIYNLVEKLIYKKKYINYEKELNNIIDIEKYHKSLGNNKLQPFQYYRLTQSYISIKKLINDISKNDFDKFFDYSELLKFNEYYNKFTKYFNIDNLELYNFNNANNLNVNIFNNGIYDEIDQIINQIKNEKELLNRLSSDLSKLINNDNIDIKYTDRDGYYISLTKIRANKLKKAIENMPIYNDLIFENKTLSNCYITSKYIKNISKNILNYQDKLYEITKIKYFHVIKELYNKYFNVLNYINYFISYIDLIKSYAKVSLIYNYYKPKINDKLNKSFIDAIQLKHPICELLIDTEYIANDISINKDNKSGILLYSANGAGKCLSPNTLVIMYNGKRKKAKDIKIGDKLLGDDSTIRNVLGITSGTDQMYEITPKKGESFKCNGNHILCLRVSEYQSLYYDNNKNGYVVTWIENGMRKSKLFSLYKYKNKNNAKVSVINFKKKIFKTEKFINISVNDYINKSNDWKQRHYLYRVGVEYNSKIVNLDPYMIGFWLGDGTSTTSEITNQDSTCINYFKNNLGQYNCYLQYKQKYTYRINGINQKIGNHFLNYLKKYNLLNNKHIPDDYLINSRKIRLQVLAGLLDSDGSLNKNGYDFIQKNELLFDNVIELVRSLGLTAYKSKITKSCCNNGKSGTYFRCHITGTYDQLNEIPILIERKKIKFFKNHFIPSIIKFTIKKLNVDRYCGFELDGNHKFLLNDYTVSHNSTLSKAVALNLIMAQIGCFVSSSYFEYYPYSNIFTRISHNDNLFKGHSSFEVEILELSSIINYSNSNSLIICDEILNSTENISAVSLISSSINHFLNNNISFICCSHLHELPNYIDNTLKEKIYICHLKTEYDQIKKTFTYNRKLCNGISEQYYGLIIAKALLNNNNILNNALQIQNKILNGDNKLIINKKSNYNSKLLVNECYICNENKNLHVHHIIEQQYFDSDNKCTIKGKLNIKKNSLSNLVVLCYKCHQNVHLHKLKINGWKLGSNGRFLDYKIINN